MCSSTGCHIFLLAGSGLVVAGVIIYALRYSIISAESTIANTRGVRAKPSLKFVVVVSRHGNRGPLFSYPNCPFPPSNQFFWPYGVNQLTRSGRVQMYNLGVKIRSLYSGFLNQIYYPEDFKAYSTLMDRTLMSAQQLLAGLYPPTGFQIWNYQIPWQPISIYPSFNDYTQRTNTCPKYVEAQTRAMLKYEEENGAHNIEFLQSIEPYTQLTAQPGKTSEAIITFSDCFLSGGDEGLSIPTWAKRFYPDCVSDMRAKTLEPYITDSDNLIRFLQGPLFQEIIYLMDAKVNGTMNPNRQMHYYSGHDTTLLGLQAILGILSNGIKSVVRPASALIFELHQLPETSYHFVEVQYIDGALADLEPTALDIPNCGSPCNFHLLKNVTEKYYNVTDYEKECQLD